MTFLPQVLQKKYLCWYLLFPLSFFFLACLNSPPPQAEPGWVTLQPNIAKTIIFNDPIGLLTDVYLGIPAGAVTEPTTIHIYVPNAATPIFFAQDIQLRTPTIVIEPINITFTAPITLGLPWYSFAETIANTDIQGFSSADVAGIAQGLWQNESVTLALPGAVEIALTHGGVYFAGTQEDNAARIPSEPFGEPCLDASSGLENCDTQSQCVISGCLGQLCSLSTASLTCRPDKISIARMGCACRCSAALCQWVR